MPPEGRARQVSREWLRRARSNLALAKQPKPPEALWEDLCFDAQQAGEKAVKAVLVLHQIDSPRTHRLGELLVILSRAGHPVPDHVWEADVLSDYATLTRYPGSPATIGAREHERALALADGVVRWAEGIVEQ